MVEFVFLLNFKILVSGILFDASPILLKGERFINSKNIPVNVDVNVMIGMSVYFFL